jgi:hypothetical protein
VTTPTPLGTAFAGDKLARATHKAPATTKRPARSRKAAGGDA